LLLILLAIILYGSICAVIFTGSEEGDIFFPDLFTAYMNFFIGLYSLNFPDIMIPAFNETAAWTPLFLSYVMVVAWFLMAIVLATIFDVYKRGLKREVASKLYQQHQRLAAAWQLLGGHLSGKLPWTVWKQLLTVLKPHYSPERIDMLFRILDKGQKGYLRYREFLRVADLLTYRLHRIDTKPHVFERISPWLYHSKVSQIFRRVVLHKFTLMAVDAVIVATVIFLLVELQLQLIGFNVSSEITFENHASEYILFFILWIEFLCQIYALGPMAYWRQPWHKFDMLLLVFVSVGFVILLSQQNTPVDWRKVIFISRLLRLVRLFARVGRFNDTLSSIYDAIPALRSILLLQVVLYYIFALVGMQVWAGKVKADTPALQGTQYAQWGYTIFNFNSFAEAILTLFQLNVISNYNITALGYGVLSGKAAWIFFVLFHLLAVIVMFNVLVAFIIEAFQKRQGKKDAMLKRIEKITTKHEDSAGFTWKVEERRDPFHTLRRLLLDEILDEGKHVSWMKYLDEDATRENSSFKRSSDLLDSDSDDGREPPSERDVGRSFSHVPTTVRRKRTTGIEKIGNRLKRAWARKWREKEAQRFYAPRISRDDYSNEVHISWDDEEEDSE